MSNFYEKNNKILINRISNFLNFCYKNKKKFGITDSLPTVLKNRAFSQRSFLDRLYAIIPKNNSCIERIKYNEDGRGKFKQSDILAEFSKNIENPQVATVYYNIQKIVNTFSNIYCVQFFVFYFIRMSELELTKELKLLVLIAASTNVFEFLLRTSFQLHNKKENWSVQEGPNVILNIELTEKVTGCPMDKEEFVEQIGDLKFDKPKVVLAANILKTLGLVKGSNFLKIVSPLLLKLESKILVDFKLELIFRNTFENNPLVNLRCLTSRDVGHLYFSKIAQNYIKKRMKEVLFSEKG